MHVKFTHRTVHENTVVFVCRQHSVSLLEVVHALSGEVESTGVQVGHLAHFECPFYKPSVIYLSGSSDHLI